MAKKSKVKLIYKGELKDMKKKFIPNIALAVSFILIIGILICNISIAYSIENIQKQNNETKIETLEEESETGGIGYANIDGIASTSYTVSDAYAYISSIPPKTAVSDFKKEFNIEEGKVHLYQDTALKQEVTQRKY